MASHVGTGPTFAGATAAGICLAVGSALAPSGSGASAQTLRQAWPALATASSPPACG